MTDVSVPFGSLITLKGPAEFVAQGQRALELVDVPLEELLTKPTTIRYVANIGLPAPSWSKGFWRSRIHTADVRQLRRPDGSVAVGQIRYLTIHEALGHGSDDDVLAGKRRSIMDLMDPRPSSWTDGGNRTGMARYWHLPFECYANRLVEALTAGHVRSGYDDDYTRWIRDVDLEKLVDLVITEPVDPDTELPAIPVPEPPPDPALEIALARVAQLEQLIRAESVEIASSIAELKAEAEDLEAVVARFSDAVTTET